MSIRIDFTHDSGDQQLAQVMQQYAFGYGAWPEGSLIADGLKGIDRRKAYAKVIRKKAVLDTTAAIIHTTTDQQIVDTTRRETPLQELLPMETARGKTAAYDILKSRGAAAFVAETVTLSTGSAVTDTYVNATVNLAILTATGGWTDFAIASMAAQYPSRDARALEIRNKTWTLNESWENELINGNQSAVSAAAGLGGNLSLGFSGIRTFIYNSSSAPTGTASDLLLSKGAAPIALGDIDTVLNNMVQINVKPNLSYTDLQTWQYIKGLFMTQARYVNPETEIAWGLRALGFQTPYGLLPIIADKFAPNLSGLREFGILDTKFLAQRILLDATFELFAKTTIQQTFVVKKFGSLIDKTDQVPGLYAGSSDTSKMGLIYGLP